MSKEPLFWYRPRSDGGYEGPLHSGQIEDVRKASGAWVPLFASEAPVSAEQVGEVVLFGGDSDLKEVSWRRGKMPPPGTKLYTASAAAQPDVTQQTLDDVKTGIPARDAEIAALRKQNKDLLVQAVEDIAVIHRLCCRRAEISEVVTPDVPLEQHDTADLLDRVKKAVSAQAQQPVSGADGLPTSPTQGMTLGQRIAHVGGRENAQGYVEFGSPMAVNALIQHVLRDFHRQGRVNLAPAQKDADKVDAERYRLIRAKVYASNATGRKSWSFHYDNLPTPLSNPMKGSVAGHFDDAIDTARKEPDQ